MAPTCAVSVIRQGFQMRCAACRGSKGAFTTQVLFQKLSKLGSLFITCLAGVCRVRQMSIFVRSFSATAAANLTLLEQCKERQIRRVIFASSGGTVYGATGGSLNVETMLPAPISAYGLGKPWPKVSSLFMSVYLVCNRLHCELPILTVRIRLLFIPRAWWRRPSVGLYAATHLKSGKW